MKEENDKLDLHVNDLVLMNVVDIGEKGPIFGVIGQVGTIDLEEEPTDSPSGNSQVDYAVMSAQAPGVSTSEDLPHGSLVNSAIAELEERRAALDIAIQEMKRDVPKAEDLRLKDGVGIPSTAAPASEISPLVATARRLRRYGEPDSEH